VAKEYLSTKGAVLLLSVYDYDRLKSDDFAGEIVVHLSSIPQIHMDRHVDSMPVLMMPLKRPAKDAEGPFSVSLRCTCLIISYVYLYRFLCY
jgi:hypothetical protein